MCGIFGFLDFRISRESQTNKDILQSMSNEMIHRGPDGSGFWQDESNIVNLGHRRLSIIDLSDHGSQPMVSGTKRYVIVFNGEIYNFEEIKKELLDSYILSFRGHSDTEVILSAIENWGIEKTIKKLVGMFAIALYDRAENNLYLVRDRLGEKPLYYGWSRGQFIFASELKAFKKHPSFTNDISNEVLGLYFKYNYIPAPYTIYNNVYKLIPGSILKLDLSTKSENTEKYWHLDKNETLKNLDEDELINSLENMLKTSVKRQMLASDVPIGAFLSGGVDSSTVVAIMQSLSERPVNTFSIGFNEDKFNEAQYAKKVAEYLGTNHTELYLTTEEAHKIVPELPFYYDEPFADSSQIPTFLVSRLAKEHVTVSLSGDGGDELFGGYERYTVMNELVKKIDILPNFAKSGISKLINNFEKSQFSTPINSRFPKFTDRLYRGSELLNNKSQLEIYDYFISSWKSSKDLGIKNENTLNGFVTNENSILYSENSSYLEWMMYVDLNMYLPDDILVKVDRASMANSLESRVPLLDHNIVEFAHNLPLKYKIRGDTQKWILKQIMYKYLPPNLMDRQKKGFGVPVGQWIKGPLRDWAEELLDENKIKEQGYFNYKIINEMWNQHKEGHRNWQTQLWSVLMFQAWMEK